MTSEPQAPEIREPLPERKSEQDKPDTKIARNVSRRRIVIQTDRQIGDWMTKYFKARK